jgi:hypothetical protein
MANTIINPKPAHLSGDSAKFHSKVGGKSHKGRKTHKTHKGRKSMKSKKSRKTMRKTMRETMGKKSGGDYNPVKGLLNIAQFRTRSGLTQTQKQCKKKVESEKKENCKDVKTLYRDKCNEKIRKDKWKQDALNFIRGTDYAPPRTKFQQATEEGEHCADFSNDDRQILKDAALKQHLNCTEKYDNESKNCEKQVN